MNINDFILDINHNLIETMKFIDDRGYKNVFIVENNKLVGLVSDGDIRRAILNGVLLDTNISEIMNKNPSVIHDGYILEDTNRLIEKNRDLPINEMFPYPVLNKNGEVVDIFFISAKGYEGSIDGDVRYNPVKLILVVGGAGYLGSVLCRRLLFRGYKVRVLDNLTYGNEGIKELLYNPNFEFIKGDIRNIQTVIDAIKDVDTVIHLAAIVGDPASLLNPKETIEVNYLATKTLAEICKYSQINRFIFASTCSVYGASEHNKLLTEESKLNPVSLYAEMKLKSEQGILEIADENFSPTILRMGTLYGRSPRMRFDLVVNILTIKALKEKKFTIFGGEQCRAICHVRDVADVYVECIQSPINVIGSQIFNVASENIKINDVGDEILSLIPHCTKKIEEAQKDIRDYMVSTDKLKNILNYKYYLTIKDGIGEIISDVLDSNLYEDYTDSKYSNYAYLKGEQ